MIIMDRKIAEAGRYPAIDVLRSLSRVAASCLDEAQTATVRRARAMLSLHGDMVDMVRLGAYRAGTDAAVDEALRLIPAIEDFLRQAPGDRSGFDEFVPAPEPGTGGSAWHVTRCRSCCRCGGVRSNRRVMRWRPAWRRKPRSRTGSARSTARHGGTAKRAQHGQTRISSWRCSQAGKKPSRPNAEAVAADLAAAAVGTGEARGVVVGRANARRKRSSELIGEREAASQADATRQEQHVLDDIARARLLARQQRRSP